MKCILLSMTLLFSTSAFSQMPPPPMITDVPACDQSTLDCVAKQDMFWQNSQARTLARIEFDIQLVKSPQEDSLGKDFVDPAGAVAALEKSQFAFAAFRDTSCALDDEILKSNDLLGKQSCYANLDRKRDSELKSLSEKIYNFRWGK